MNPETGKCRLRLCYYMIGVRGRMKGKWVFGQFATTLPIPDFKKLIRKAQRRGWM